MKVGDVFYYCAVAAVLPPAHVLLKLAQEQVPAAQQALFVRYAVLLAIAPFTGALLMVILVMLADGLDKWVMAPFALMLSAYWFAAWSLLATLVSALAWFALKIPIKPKSAVIGVLAASVWAATLIFGIPGGSF